MENEHKVPKKKILMVHNFYQIGGGEHTVFKNEVDLLRSHGHEVIEYTRSNDELKASKVKLALSPFSTLWSFKTYREVKRIIKDENIDIVHCHNTFPLISPSVYYAARSQKVPVIQTVHNFRFLCPNGTFYCNGHICEECREKNNFCSALKNRCYRNSLIQTLVVTSMLRLHRILGTYKKISYIFLTDFNRKKFEKLIDINGDNVFVKPNFVKEQDAGKRDADDAYFVYAGRLEDSKGIKALLEAWCQIEPGYHLHIYGDGPLKDYIKEKANLFPKIEYRGFCPQEIIQDDLRAATATIFPSTLYEGFPMIVAESFSCGCPVIATNIGNHAEMVRRANGGALYNPDSVSELEGAIKYVIENNEKLSRNALNYASENLSPQEGYSSIISIYDSAPTVGGGKS